MTTRTFAITWEYRCPFARNANEHVIAGLRAGADWDVEFVPFSLGQLHLEEDESDIWGRWADDSGLLGLQAGTVIRDRHPDRFLDVHEALFTFRHEHGGRLRDAEAVGEVLAGLGLDARAVLDEIDGGEPIATVRREHEAAAKTHSVWGVPTFILGEAAAFVRLMDRPQGDGDHAIHTINRVLDLLEDEPELNEFKHTSVPR